jgi:hypothetical protein
MLMSKNPIHHNIDRKFHHVYITKEYIKLYTFSETCEGVALVTLLQHCLIVTFPPIGSLSTTRTHGEDLLSQHKNKYDFM